MYATSQRPLSREYLQHYVPSIFATEQHESRLDRYTYVPTIDILEGLEGEGYQVYGATQSSTKVAGRGAFTKHMLKLRKGNEIKADVSELTIINAHDGSSSVKGMLGRYREVCSNGLLACSPSSEFSVHHKGDIVSDVIEGVYSIINQADEIEESIDTLKSIQLDSCEISAFCNSALMLKYDQDDHGNIFAPIRADQLNRPHRREDIDNSIWTTFNRVQENLIKGGLRGRTVTGNRTSTRGVKGIDENVRLNRALWQLAESMAALKA